MNIIIYILCAAYAASITYALILHSGFKFHTLKFPAAFRVTRVRRAAMQLPQDFAVGCIALLTAALAGCMRSARRFFQAQQKVSHTQGCITARAAGNCLCRGGFITRAPVLRLRVAGNNLITFHVEAAR